MSPDRMRPDRMTPGDGPDSPAGDGEGEAQVEVEDERVTADLVVVLVGIAAAGVLAWRTSDGFGRIELTVLFWIPVALLAMIIASAVRTGARAAAGRTCRRGGSSRVAGSPCRRTRWR